MKLHQIGITLKGSYTYNFRYVQLLVQVLGKKIYVYAFTFNEIDTILEFIYMYWEVKLFLVIVTVTKIYYGTLNLRICHDLPIQFFKFFILLPFAGWFSRSFLYTCVWLHDGNISFHQIIRSLYYLSFIYFTDYSLYIQRIFSLC